MIDDSDTPNMTDRQILQLYSEWSEDAYAAGFISPSEETVRRFREWLKGPRAREDLEDKPLEDYEVEMLEIFKRQEQ